MIRYIAELSGVGVSRSVSKGFYSHMGSTKHLSSGLTGMPSSFQRRLVA